MIQASISDCSQRTVFGPKLRGAGKVPSAIRRYIVEVPRPVFCLTSRSRNRRSSVSLVIANHLSGPRISRRRFAFNWGSKSSTDDLGHFSAADYVASLPWAATLHEWRQSPAVLTASSTHRGHYAQLGQDKRSLRLSAEALSRSSEQIGRMVELQIDHRAYEDPPTHNLKVIGSNPIPATTFVITRSPSRSNRRDGLAFWGSRSRATNGSQWR